MADQCQINAEHIAELRERMAAVDKESESFRRRLADHDDRLGQISDLALAIQRQSGVLERVVESQHRTETSIDRVEKRVVELEREPADRWKKMAFEVIKWAVIGALGIVAGYFLS